MANPRLQIDNGADAKSYELEIGTDEVIVGRSTECHWVISSGAVSRRHARLRRQSGEITLEDLGSSNGTFVNGERLAEPMALKDQDAIKFGSVEGRFFVPKPEPESDATIAIGDLPPTIMVKPSPAATIMVPPPPEASAPPPPPPPAPQVAPPPAQAAPPPPPPQPHFAETGTMAAPPPSAGAQAASSDISSDTMAAPPPRADESFAGGDTAFRPAPSQRTTTSATAPIATAARPRTAAPSMLELGMIAGGSFLLVFGVGALLIRFVF